MMMNIGVVKSKEAVQSQNDELRNQLETLKMELSQERVRKLEKDQQCVHLEHRIKDLSTDYYHLREELRNKEVKFQANKSYLEDQLMLELEKNTKLQKRIHELIEQHIITINTHSSDHTNKNGNNNNNNNSPSTTRNRIPVHRNSLSESTMGNNSNNSNNNSGSAVEEVDKLRRSHDVLQSQLQKALHELSLLKVKISNSESIVRSASSLSLWNTSSNSNSNSAADLTSTTTTSTSNNNNNMHKTTDNATSTTTNSIEERVAQQIAQAPTGIDILPLLLLLLLILFVSQGK